MAVDLVFKVGDTTLSEFGDFIRAKGWKCSHCNHDEYLIEEYGNTGKCSVSSMPYIAASPEGKFYITGSGAPSFTVLCANCFAITKYNAHEVVKSVVGGSNVR